MKTRTSGAALLVAIFALLGSNASGTANAALSVTGGQSCTAAQPLTATVHRAGLVVTFGDRHTQRFCIEFSEDSITGLQLLQRSGLPIVTSSMSGLGGAVCAIGSEGSNDPTNCFASCTGSTCAYWAYYQFANGAWSFSQLGASQHPVHDGDIEGWAWGAGGVSSGAIPDQPGEICPVPTAVPTANPTATPVPTQRPQEPSAADAPEPTDVILANTAIPPIPPPPADGIEAETPVVVAPSAESPAIPLPTVYPESTVLGVERSPRTANQTATSTTAQTTSTPRRGAVVIDSAQGNENEAHADAPTTHGGGGNRTTVFVFVGLVVALLSVGTAVVLRRRQLG